MSVRGKISVLVMTLFLAGCQYLPGFPTGGESTEPIESPYAETIQRIQEHAVKFCSFLPTYASVLAMLTAQDPTVTGALNIATAICDAVTSKPHSLMSDYYTKESCPKVNGVCIDGDRVPDGK